MEKEPKHTWLMRPQKPVLYARRMEEITSEEVPSGGIDKDIGPSGRRELLRTMEASLSRFVCAVSAAEQREQLDESLAHEVGESTSTLLGAMHSYDDAYQSGLNGRKEYGLAQRKVFEAGSRILQALGIDWRLLDVNYELLPYPLLNKASKSRVRQSYKKGFESGGMTWIRNIKDTPRWLLAMLPLNYDGTEESFTINGMSGGVVSRRFPPIRSFQELERTLGSREPIPTPSVRIHHESPDTPPVRLVTLPKKLKRMEFRKVFNKLPKDVVADVLSEEELGELRAWLSNNPASDLSREVLQVGRLLVGKGDNVGTPVIYPASQYPNGPLKLHLDNYMSSDSWKKHYLLVMVKRGVHTDQPESSKSPPQSQSSKSLPSGDLPARGKRLHGVPGRREMLESPEQVNDSLKRIAPWKTKKTIS